MPSQTKIVGTGADVANPGAARSWADPNAITIDDSTGTGFSGGGLTTNQYSNWLSGYNCSFTIPSRATIDGILFEMWARNLTSSGTSYVDSLLLMKNNVRVGTDKGDLGVGSGSHDWVVAGGAADKWGLSWTPAEINAVGFGAAFYIFCASAGDPHNYDIEHMRLTVYYTDPKNNTGISLLGAGHL